MPTYEYECLKCGKVFDVFHGMSEEGPKKCEDTKCKGKVKKLISAGSGLIFKGSGFYITDYKNKSGGGKSEKSSTAEAASSSSEGGSCSTGCGCHSGTSSSTPAKAEKSEKKSESKSESKAKK